MNAKNEKSLAAQCCQLVIAPKLERLRERFSALLKSVNLAENKST